MYKHRFIIKGAKRQRQIILFAFRIEHIISLTFFLMRVIFDGFDFALILVTTKALAQSFFGLLP